MTQTLLLLGNQSIILPLLLLLLFWRHERKFYPKGKKKWNNFLFFWARPMFQKKKKKKSRDLRRRLYVRQKVVELKRIKNNKITKNREKFFLSFLSWYYKGAEAVRLFDLAETLLNSFQTFFSPWRWAAKRIKYWIFKGGACRAREIVKTIFWLLFFCWLAFS